MFPPFVDAATRLRSSPRWELVLRDRLPPAEQRRLGGDDEPIYGLLRPRDGRPEAKVVGPDAALLFLTLQEPSSMPSYVRHGFGNEAEGAIAELIADGILEVERGDGWFSGPRAFAANSREWNAAASGPASSRSRRALEAASAHPSEDPDRVAAFLYRYGATPLTPARAGRWGDADAIRGDLRVDDYGRPTRTPDGAWWMFTGDAGRGTGRCPKLYLGVALSELGAALRDAMTAVRAAGLPMPAWKLGATPAGLHRPDRWVVYPATPGMAAELARVWTRCLADRTADPVPFTAPLDEAGHVSWGEDRPRSGTGRWNDDGSWRYSITRVLGRALVAARQTGESDPTTFARQRIRLAGCDPDHWQPLDAPSEWFPCAPTG